MVSVARKTFYFVFKKIICFIFINKINLMHPFYCTIIIRLLNNWKLPIKINAESSLIFNIFMYLHRVSPSAKQAFN